MEGSGLFRGKTRSRRLKKTSLRYPALPRSRDPVGTGLRDRHPLPQRGEGMVNCRCATLDLIIKRLQWRIDITSIECRVRPTKC